MSQMCDLRTAVGRTRRTLFRPLLESAREAAPALGLFIAVRGLCLAALTAWSHAAGSNAHVLLSQRWDSLWYARVATHGYDYVLQAPDGRMLSNMAFFPLLPWLEESLTLISPLGPTDAGLAISAAASLAAAWAIFAIGDHLYGPRVGILLTGLWASLPVGIVQSMAYSESLFVALSAWALYSVMRGHWITAGILACLAGLTRPVGLAVACAMLVAAWQLCKDQKKDRSTSVRNRFERVLIGCAIAPMGALGYILWVGHRKDSFFGYLDVQAEWGNGFDGGAAFARFIFSHASASPFVGGMAMAIGTVLLFWAYRLCARQRQPISLLVYTALIIALAMGTSGYFGSKPRLLVPAFPLLLPAACALANTRRSYRYMILTATSVAAAVYGAFWLNGSGPP